MKEAANTVESPETPSPVGTCAPGDEKEEGNVVAKMKERKYRIEKDVVRTDRHVPYYEGAATDQAIPPNEHQENTEERVFSEHLRMLRDILITYTTLEFESGTCYLSYIAA